MTFTHALLIIVALAAVALGLVCYHLLSRLDLLERSVLGGLEPPTRRLTREEFEQRFARAAARSRLAAEVESGLVLVLGAESPSSDVASALANLQRADGVVLISTHDNAQAFIDGLRLPALRQLPFDSSLGIAVTPHALVIDESRIITARATASADDLVELLRAHT